MSIPELISGISLGSAYVRPGTEGAITSVSFIAGGWITVDSFGDLTTIDHSRTSTGQIAFVSQSQQFYIAKKIPADFETTFDDSVGWTKLTFSGSFSGSFFGDGSGLTGIASSLFLSGSTGNDILNLKTDALTLTGSAQGIVVAVTDNKATFSISNTVVITGSFKGDGSGLTGVGGVPGGTNGQVQYNSASVFEGAEIYYTSAGSVGLGITNPSARLVVAGDAVITGKITAEEFHTEFVSASIIYQSGSTKFGNSADDNHMFTGTVNITGSVIAPRFSGSFSGSFQGDGSQLTGIASTLALSGSTGNDVINLKTEALTITGSANNIDVAVASNTATVTVSNNLALSNVSLTGSFTGNFSGSVTAVITNAISASYATNAVSASVSDKVKVSTSGTNASYYPTFVDGTGYQDVLIDSGNNITYNPSTNALTATTFVGALTGNASTATSASFATTASHATGYVKDGGGVADQIMVWKDEETASGSAALRYNTGGATLNVTGNVIATSFTGSFTGSFAGTVANAVSASFAFNAISASYAATASSADAFIVRNTLIASGLTYPIADGLENQYIQTNGAGTLSFNDVHTLLEEVRSGEALTKGDPLYISGSLGAKPIVYKADAGVPAKMPVIYIALETVNSGSDTRGIVLGLIEGVDTTGYPTGTEIYVAVGGGWTSTRPTGSATVQSLGYITKEGSGGKGIILNPGPFNLPNLQKDYVWKGNTNGVPVAVASSSLIVTQALNATSASFATSANTATSASHAIFANTAGTATTATSASFATFANTAGTVTSASFATFANTAGTATSAATASFVAGYAKGTGVANQVTIWKDSSTVSGSSWLRVTSSIDGLGTPGLQLDGNYYSYAVSATGGSGFVAFSGSVATTASLIAINASATEGQLYSGDGGVVKSAIRLSTIYTDAYTIGRFLTPGANNLLRIAPDVLILGTTTINGDLVVGGKVTAEEFHTEFVSASIIFQSGSTIFGNSSDDTHLFTGSVNISHQLYAGLDSEVRPQVVGYNTATGELTYFNSSSILATAIPGGSDNQVQYNDNGVMAGASGFVWTGTSVGIGTSAPVYTLVVDGDSSEGAIGIERTTVGSNTVIGAVNFTNNNGGTVYGRVRGGRNAAGDGYVSLGTGLGDNLYALEGGNVGIGTTSPTAKLQVNGDITTGDASIIKSVSNFLLVQGATNLVLDGATGTVNIRTNSTDKLVVTNAGNIGIGTASPAVKLHVYDTTQGRIAIETSGSRRFDIVGDGDGLVFRDQSASANRITLSTAGALKLHTYGSGTNTGTATKTLAVNSSGEVIELDVSSNGTGVGNEVAFWKDTDTVSGSQSLTWNGSTFYINGTLEATEKSFVIDHPTLPGKRLVYGVLEGPEHAVYCRGKISGEVIQLPEEWTGLVDQESITVQLTPIGRHQNLYVVDIKNNQVLIRNGDLLSSRISAHYFIQATRKDVKPLATVREA